MVLRVLLLFIPLPMFWALFDQQVGANAPGLPRTQPWFRDRSRWSLTVPVCDFGAGFSLDHPGCQDEHGFCKSYLPIDDMA